MEIVAAIAKKNHNAIKNMKNVKSSGLEGVRMELIPKKMI